MRATLAGLLFCALPTLVAAQAGAPRPVAPDAAATASPLTDCLAEADIRHAAIEAYLRGATRSALAEQAGRSIADPRLRERAERILGELARTQPPEAEPYVIDRLQRCVSEAGGADGLRAVAASGNCYRLSRIVRELFLAREAGISLAVAQRAAMEEAGRQGLGAAAGERLARLAESVYLATEPAPSFRAVLFMRCVASGAR